MRSGKNDVSAVHPAYNTHPTLFDKVFGYAVSVILHPIFIPMYVAYFLLYIHPGAFTGFSAYDKLKTFSIIGINVVLFPLIATLLSKAVGFIDSIQLHTRKDRIIPLIAAGIFFFWAYLVFKEQHQYPLMLVAFLLGIFLASSAGLMANIFFKVSLHGIGMGGWLGFFLALLLNGELHMAWPLALVIALTGLVATARLMISSHTPREIYYGIVIGILSQWAALIFTGI